MTEQSSYINYLLQLADNALIHGQRLSEWTGHGPVLEQDIALTNIALDHIGAARALYQYAANKINELNQDSFQKLFKAPLLQQKFGAISEDDLAFLRDAWDFKNFILLEQPNGDWDTTLAKCFLFDHFNVLNLKQIIAQSKDLQLVAIAEKTLKEALYHQKWSSEWIIRMGDGTALSHQKIQTTLNDLLTITQEFFIPSTIEQQLINEGYLLNLPSLQNKWLNNVKDILAIATLEYPEEITWRPSNGKNGQHSEHLGYILAEMQFMQRAYPNMEW